MKAPWAAYGSQQGMAPGPSQPLAFVNKDFSKQCLYPSGVYCLGLLLSYKGRLESLQKRSPGLQAPSIDSVALTEGVPASAAGGDGRAATLCADREHTKPSLKAVECSVGRFSGQVSGLFKPRDS